MSTKRTVESSDAVGQAVAGVRSKHIDLMTVGEFKQCFIIPNGVSVQLLKGGPVPTHKADDNSICFFKKQFNAGLRLPLPSLFKQFLHFTKIPLALIHPNVVRVLMGCSILDMLFNLELSLLEVFFVYIVKKAKSDIFSLAANIPSLQLVTGLLDSIKGATKGHVIVKGP